MKKKIEGATFDNAHILQNLTDVKLYDCTFVSGDDVLNGSRDIVLENRDIST